MVSCAGDVASVPKKLNRPRPTIMYVFRSERRLMVGEDVRRGLCDALSSNTPAGVLDALLRAGELECGFADADVDDDQLSLAHSITDTLANHLVQQSKPGGDLLETIARLQPPEQLCISKPEGFAYYGLHPLDYARLADSFSGSIPRAAVIGLRSIGTTQSAVVAAALQRRGIPAQRITTRPHGHPFDRRCTFNPQQLCWIRSHLESSAHFFLVDEGPGLSGSSLLSVAEALVEEGVPSAKITLFCSHQPNPEHLRALDAVRRWKNFRSNAVAFGNRKPEQAGEWIGSGLWRSHNLLLGNLSEHQQPPSWTQMERAKYLSHDGATLYKFEGLGRYGKEVANRSQQLAETGFSPRLLQPLDPHGYVGYERVDGACFHPEPDSGKDLSEDVLRTLAGYCAMRVHDFACDLSPAALDEVGLEEMCRVNAVEEFGIEIHPPAEFLFCERPVIADARMMPHEWIRTASGGMVKSDAAGHGDDHFFPGPCDIAWDLAGVIIEWKLPPSAADFFIRRYRRLSGDDADRRLPHYLLAYSLFRMGYCKMASEAMQGSAEEARLVQAFKSYREAAWNQICQNGFAATREIVDTSPATSRTLQPSPPRSAALLP